MAGKLAIVALFCGLAAMADPQLEGVRVSNAWARALPPVSPTGAAYLTVANEGTATVSLVAADSEIADRVEIHSHTMEGGVMKMRPVDRVEVAPGAEVVFEPGGLHVMLIGLREPLEAGKAFTVGLRFEDGGRMETTVSVKGADQQ